MFQKDALLSGCFHTIGDLRRADRICISEGYTTGAAVYRLSGNTPTVVAFTAANPTHVARAIRARAPNAFIYVTGDNDHQRAREMRRDGMPKINVGKLKAEEAADAIGGYGVLPRFEDNETHLSDWHDALTAHGFEETRRRYYLALPIAEREKRQPFHTNDREV